MVCYSYYIFIIVRFYILSRKEKKNLIILHKTIQLTLLKGIQLVFIVNNIFYYSLMRKYYFLYFNSELNNFNILFASSEYLSYLLFSTFIFFLAFNLAIRHCKINMSPHAEWWRKYFYCSVPLTLIIIISIQCDYINVWNS